MRATSLLLGCLLGLSATAAAAATGSSVAGTLGAAANSSYNCNQSSEHNSNHDVPASGGGDAMGVSHSAAVPSAATSRRGAGSSSDSDVPHFGDDASPNHSSHGSGLSWQSLLPGSIQ